VILSTVNVSSPALPSEGRGPGRREILFILAVVLLTKVLHLGVGYGVASRTGAGEVHSNRVAQGVPMFAWDSLHYREIVVRGYPSAVGEKIPERIAFFPLYPLLAKGLAFLNPETALLIVANVASILGFLWFYLWAYRAQGQQTARWAVLVALAYPPAMFLSAAYTEAVFFLLTALTFWFLQKENMLSAAVSSGLACASRPTGLALSVIVVLAEITRTPWTWSAARLSRLALLGLVSVFGLLLYEGYLISKYGRWDAYFAAQRHWEGDDRTVNSNPVQPEGEPPKNVGTPPTEEGVHRWARKLLSPGAWNKVFAGGMVLLGIAGWFCLPEKLRAGSLLPLIIFLLGFLPGWGARLTSIARFETAAIPVFLFLASRIQQSRHPLRWGPVLAAGGVLQLWYVLQFNAGGWCG
jgi:hypothetical protein